MLRISNGYSPEYLLKEVATGRENYYTGAVAEGEPPGRWWGAGAEKLGLRGLVDAADMRAVYERFLDPRCEGFNDPSRWEEVNTLGQTGRAYKSEEELYAEAIEREPGASPERRAELRVEAGKNARRNVAFYDATFSVQKSVTLLHTAFEAKEVAARTAGDEESAQAWGRFRTAVEDAIWAGNNAGLTYLQDKAGYTRIGHHGGAAGRHADAHEWTVASFFQHDSRERDPQLHIHNTILNRVEGPDGKWLTVDGRSLHRWRTAGAAVAERTTEERITATLGMLLATRPDGKAREVVGVSAEAMDLISTRRRKLTAKAAELVADFEARYGRAPTSYERERIHQAATLVTRKAKSHDGETRAELLERIDSRIRADISGGLAGVADAALAARTGNVAAQTWSPSAVMETALADVQSRKAAWTRADLTAAINAALPDYLGTTDGADVARLLDGLTEQALRSATPLDAARPADEALPAALRLANGESVYQQPGAQLYATPDHVRTERYLVAAAAHGDAATLPAAQVERFLTGLAEQGIELGVDQAAAVRGVLTSGARIETLVGPAGTGKSFVVGALAKAWSDPELSGGPVRRVFGLATSQVATNVLAGEGLRARNVSRWLTTQERLAAPGAEIQAQAQGEDASWRLHAGDLVVVDESAMTDTAALAAIHKILDAAGAKLLLVGDHKQLAAVGAGGGMDLLANSGARYELADARRFTADWERAASLRLRAGDEAVLRDYHQHGRLLDSGTVAQAEESATRAWLADTLAGQRSLLLVDSNEQAARLSSELRAELVRLGRVEETGVSLGLEGTTAGVGDVVQARRNGWHLAGVEGNRRGPINRETYKVTAVREDGSLEVTPATGPAVDGMTPERMVLPTEYVAADLALGYATTVHAAQGATVDTAHTVVTGRTGPAALYVGMSRGRESNTAHVMTVSVVEDAADGREDQTIHRDPIAALSGLLDPDEARGSKSALATATESSSETEAVRTPAELLADASQLAATDRTVTWLDELTADGTLSFLERARIAAEDGAASLTRVLRRAELAGRDARQTLVDAVAGRPLSGARNVTNVVYARITERDRFDPEGRSWAEWTPTVTDPEWQSYLARLAAAADQRTADLGAQAAVDASGWAVQTFGEVPEDPTERASWQEKVATVAGYRELRGHDSDDPADVLGQAPAPGQTEAFAAYRAAWRTLGRADTDREEMELTDGQLHVRVRAAAREDAWGPRYVGNELAGTRQAAASQRQTVALRTAEAAAADPDEQGRLEQEAADAAALAQVLDEQAAKLQEIDDARAIWLAHTAQTRVRGERSKAELAIRHTDEEPEPQVTAEEWITADKAAREEDDAHRDITEADLYQPDQHHTRAEDTDDTGEATVRTRDERMEVAVEPDVREIAVREPAQVDEDVVRVPSADETSVALDDARRALAEVTARQVLDAQDTEQRAAELVRWHTDDHPAEHGIEEERSPGDEYADA
ncbi:MobF family relaxase [Pseudonocardia sp. T1-2H]|uniref:MobF family relaxase n=1 Tax=Pseudonocardia sp. T1-2H TaxID=3128899 RepID=UPI003100E5E3